MSGAPGRPKWFTPLRLLLIFCIVNLFVYLDRGLIASNGVNGSPPSEANPEGTGIQGAFKLTYFQDGLLPAAFMVGLLVAAPLFAEACNTHSPFRLLAIGMGIWTVACAGCAIAPSFGVLLVCRMAVGVGEASFVSLAAPFIDDYAPVAAKARWFAAFYLCIPVGFALGYITGGLVTAALSWRAAFALEAACMVPFVVFASTAAPLRLAGSEREKPTARRTVLAAVKSFLADVLEVVCLPVWATVTAAYTLYVAVMGVYAYWGPQAGRQLFFGTGDDAGGVDADLAFGAVTVVTGVLGSVAGGIALDSLGSSLRTANLLCAGGTAVGCSVIICAFALTQTFVSFLCVFGVGQLCVFVLQAPVAAIGMWCVPSKLRPLGVSLMTMAIHLFGDVPSPPLLGLLQSRLAEGKSPADAAQQWRLSMGIVSSLLLASSVVFFAAAGLSKPAADFRIVTVERLVGAGGSPGLAAAGGPVLVDSEGGGDATRALLDGRASSSGLSS